MALRRIVITGANSMLGIAVIEEALASGIERVYAVVRPNSEKLYRLPKSEKVFVVESELDEYDLLSIRIKDTCDAFYHFAWKGTGKNRNSSIFGQCDNIPITIHALHSAKQLGCKKFIGAGSQAEYGVKGKKIISPSTSVNPVQNYGITKYAAGKLMLNEAAQIGMIGVWVRVFSVYGKYDKPTTMISSTIQKLLQGEKASFTPATQLWDYLYSADAGKAFLAIGENTAESKVYCLGSGQARPLYEFIYELRDMIEPNAELGIGELPYPASGMPNICADIRELTKDTGWVPTICFKDGIGKIIEERKKCD